MTDVVIIGAGGAAREASWVLREDNGLVKKWNLLGFIDDNPALQGLLFCEVPVLGDFSWLERNSRKNFQVLCAVGNPQVRKHLVQKVAKLGLSFSTVIHPTAQVSEWVEIGPGSLICAGTILTTHVKIGAHSIVNIACTVSHDTVIGAYCNINPGCHIAGAVQVGDGVDLGIGASVIQNKNIGEWSVIGAGAVVTTDIPSNVTAVGVPCRVIRMHEPEPSLAIE
jgi:sugar O-acyltransferase (sialic acid O-acetyltransferase NeuD family)